MGSIQPCIRNVHFVGSVCLADTETVFRELATAFPKQLKRIPDGETGKRGNFVLWQRSVFMKYPWIIRSLYFSLAKDPGPLTIPPEKLELYPIGYDEYALESYSKFCRLREEGVIQKGVRFQVSLPTPINVLHVSIEPAYQPDIEPVYTKAYLACVRHIQDSIPAEDLAIQWDVACEFAFLEGIISPPTHWVRSLKENVVKRVLQLAHFVDNEIEMGFHFCYGDLGHQHFVEPKDMSLLVEIANEVLEGTRKKRPVNWLHMPVPRDRTDREYFEPLKDLDLQNTELYLGLLHQHDHDGTRRRIAAASEFVVDFGVATECGLGRADDVELEGVLDIAKEVTQ